MKNNSSINGTINHKTITQLIPQYEEILLNNLTAIVERYERDPKYHFIDTKLNIITGQDFYPADSEDEYKDTTVIYTWIQGRGLEALAGHAQWLQSCSVINEQEKSNLINRIKKLLKEVINAMEKCRSANNGQLFFWMRQNGKVLTTDVNGKLKESGVIPSQSNYSDLFYAKGLLAAANYLQMPEKALEAEKYLKKVVEDIQNDNFLSDQQPFDVKNKITPVPGKKIQGPWMIALGGIALGIEYGKTAFWTDKARQFISHIIKLHINTTDGDWGNRYDFWEAVDKSGHPWHETDGTVICDPGHALEFIGLSLKCLLKIEKIISDRDPLLENCRIIFPALLKHFFTLGFNPKSNGICKAYDLVSRNAINTDMPWWSLPETIRAAALLTIYNPASEKNSLQVIYDASNAFMNNYINHDVHCMAWQTRNIDGKPVDVIPATPDADPGYHTGLSIIDFINYFSPTAKH